MHIVTKGVPNWRMACMAFSSLGEGSSNRKQGGLGASIQDGGEADQQRFLSIVAPTPANILG